MSLPNLTGVGRLTDDPSLSFAPSGTPYAKLSLAFNARRKNESGEWEDGDTFFVRSTIWGPMAENAAETLDKGTEVAVQGQLKSTQWQDKTSGEARYGTELTIFSIAPNLRWYSAKINKAQRNQPTGDNGQPAQKTAQTDQGWTENPPF